MRWRRSARASGTAGGIARATVSHQGGQSVMKAVPGPGMADVPPRFSARAGRCRCQGGTVPCHAGSCPELPYPAEDWGTILPKTSAEYLAGDSQE